jgi:hypothetical protein
MNHPQQHPRTHCDDRLAASRGRKGVALALAFALSGFCHSCTSRGTVAVGGACNRGESCVTGVCIRESNTLSSVAWLDGYCSGNCGSATCPEGLCLTLADGYSYCLAECLNDAECRAGYVCSSGVHACLPDCRLGWSCGPALVCDTATGACTLPTPVSGTTPLGESCTINTECATGLCIPEHSGTGTIAWTGGSCSQECVSTPCPTGAACAVMEDGSAYCVPACTADGDCRTGYVCASDPGGCLPDCRLGWSCGTLLVCDATSGACIDPAGADAGVADAGGPDGRGRDDAGFGGFGDAGGDNNPEVGGGGNNPDAGGGSGNHPEVGGGGNNPDAGNGGDDSRGQGPGQGGIFT